MKKTIYKWSQYYLMYSPIWKRTTKEEFQKNIKGIEKTENNNHNEFSNDRNVTIQICKQSNFNNRLNIAYNVLFSYKNINPNKLSQFWRDDFRQQIHHQLNKILLSKPINNSTLKLNQVIGSLLQMTICTNLTRPVQQSDMPDILQRGYRLKPRQEVYDLGELKKRVLLNEITKIIQGTNRQSEAICIQVLVKLVNELFSKHKIFELEIQQAHDWITTIFEETHCLELATNKVFIYLDDVIYPSQSKNSNNLTQITHFFQLFSSIKQLIIALSELCKTSNNKILNQNSLYKIHSFIDFFKSFLTENRQFMPKSLYHEVDRIETLQQAISLYESILSAQKSVNEFEKFSKKLRNFQQPPSQQNLGKQKHVRPKRLRRQFNIWKFQFFAKCILKINKETNTSQQITKISSFLFSYLEKQITTIFQVLYEQILPPKKMNNRSQSSDSSQLQISGWISLAAVCQFFMTFLPQSSTSEEIYKKLVSSISSPLRKTKQHCIKQIFNHNFQPKKKLQGRLLLEQIQKMIFLLNQLTQANESSQLFPYKFQVLKKTQILSHMFKTLQKFLVKEKQYILLEKEHKALLSSGIKFLMEQQSMIVIFGKDDLQSMHKILVKIKN